jgi:NAD+ kinase
MGRPGGVVVTAVGILARPRLTQAGTLLRELAAWLQARDIRVLVEEKTAGLMDGAASGCTVAPGREVAGGADVVVVLGGDGTLLATSHLLESPTVPIVGVNFGSLGFLTEITLPEVYPTLEAVLAGSYEYEDRRMLRAVVRRPGHPESTGDVLNDVAISKAVVSRIIELDVTVDGVFVSAFRADGLIISSPTGSTAYNLAAGGPILHPSLPAVVLTPICPHMLTNRPLVVRDEGIIAVQLHGEDVDVHITLDGQRGFPMTSEDVVTVTRSPRTLRLVKAAGRDYYEVLRTKLKWGETSRRR